MDKRTVFGMDMGTSETTQIIIAETTEDGRVAVAGHYKPETCLSGLTQVLSNLMVQHAPETIWISEPGVGGAYIEAWMEEDWPVRVYHWTAKSHVLYREIQRAIYIGDLRVPQTAVLQATKGIHFDERRNRFVPAAYRFDREKPIVIALALAWHGIKSGGVVIDFA